MAADRELRVLVAIDGSAHAKAALAAAVRFPWPAGTRVQGVTARQIRAEYRRSILLAALDRSAEAIAAGARRVLSRRWPGADVTIVDATPVDGILREAQRLRADVIVLGWRGHGAVRRLLMGSVSRGVVRGATCGILLVRGRPRDVRRVVVGFDGSANAKRAVGFVGTLRPPPGGEVTLITAVDRPAVPSQALALGGVRAAVAAEVKRLNVQRVARAKKELARAAATLTPAGWRVRTIVTSGDPLRDLLAAVNSAGADLIVIGARGVSGMRHLLLGSVAEGALNRSPVSILVVR
jgi:nucleotide-binding universal stress UspA family protein